MATTRKKSISVSLAGANGDAVPESPILRDAGARIERPVRKLHINGQEIPGSIAHAVVYEYTDEGIAERQALPGPRRTPGLEFGRDELGKKIDQRRDFRRDESEPWEAPDPMRELADRHVKPGMRAKFLAPGSIDRKGMRGYEPVLDAQGEPVRLGTLILGQMPEEKAAARQRGYEDAGRDRLSEANEHLQEEQRRFQRDAGVRPESRRAARSDADDDGLHEVRGNSAEEVLR